MPIKVIPRQEIEQWFADRGSELVSYTKINEPITFKCAKCGKICTVRNGFRAVERLDRAWCKQCNHKFVTDRLKNKPGEVQQWFKDRGSELISEYGNIDAPIKFRCSKCGGIGEYGGFCEIKKKYRDKSKKIICRDCQPNSKTSDEEVKQWLIQQGSDLVKIEKASKGYRIFFRCVKCGKIGNKVRLDKLKKENSECWCDTCIRIRSNQRRVEHYKGTGYYARRGSANGSWNPDRSQVTREEDRKTWWYNEWMRQVYKRGNNKCIISGSKKRITIHHIFNYKDFPYMRKIISNGVVLTVILHREFHKKYGYRNNTLEQFSEFFKEKTSEIAQKLGR